VVLDRILPGIGLEPAFPFRRDRCLFVTSIGPPLLAVAIAVFRRRTVDRSSSAFLTPRALR
jgi:hypothetical protein